MTKLVALAIVLAAIPAAAEPCDVRIVHAPDAVRAEVAHWLLDEATCGAPLEVRIVPTTDGLYVFARDTNGRVRERVVPDAQSAGVLIASWAASDADAPKPAISVELSYAPPAPAPLAPPRDALVRRYTPARASQPRTLAMQTFFGSTVLGMRGDYDVWRKGPWLASATMSIAHDDYIDWENRGHDELDFIDTKLMASFAAIGETERVRITWGLSAGVLASYGRGKSYFDDDPMQPSYAYGNLSVLGVSPALEATATIGLRLSPQWLVEGGALATVFTQEYETPTTMGHTTIEARGAKLLFLAGVRRSL